MYSKRANPAVAALKISKEFKLTIPYDYILPKSSISADEKSISAAFEGFSVKEIADRLELSQGTVKWHLSEARKKLRKSAKVFMDYKN